MTAIVSGNNLGLNLGSLASLGVRGLFGSATQGRNGERAYVNVSTGGLVLQDQDLALVGRGPDALSLRTYNSQGTYDFDNGDGWIGAPYKSVERVSATVLRRTDSDGSTCDYVLDPGGLYVAQVSPGAVADTISVVGGGGGREEYTWTNEATGTKELYVRQGQGRGLLQSITDLSNNALTFSYDSNDLIQTVTTSDGEVVRYAYDSHRQLTSVQSEVLDPNTGNLVVTQRIVYGYDAQRRLETVTVEVAPAAAGEAARQYVTTYAYGANGAVSGITQSDGSSLGFTYILVAGQYRIETVTDGNLGVTQFDYSVPGRTLVTDASGAATAYYYDGQGRLTEVRSGVTATNALGLAQAVYTYNASGDVTSITDGTGREVTFEYQDDRLRAQRDTAGNELTRTYTALNQLATETVQVAAGVRRTTRNVYDTDGRGLLRFTVSPEGRVTEYRYDDWGQQTAAIDYAGGTYDLGVLTEVEVPTETALAAWAGEQDLTRTMRTELAYDYRGQLTSRTTWSEVDVAGNGIGMASNESYVRDHRGLLIGTVTPQEQAVTTLVRDGMGRVVSTLTTYGDGTPASATVTQYDDANGRTTTTLARTQIDPTTQQIQVIADGLASTSVYDRAGRLVGVVESSGGAQLGTTQYAYDAAGRLRMSTDPTGARSWNLYDLAGQKVGEVSATGRLTEYVYDAGGRVTQTIAYATAVDLAALVDVDGNPVDVAPAALRTENPGQDLKSWSLYDDAGRLTWQVDALGHVTRTEYDGASRILSTTRYATPISTATLGNGIGVTLALAPATGTVQVVADDDHDRVTSNVYDGDGRLRATVDGEGYLTELRYDGAGRLVQTIRYATKVAEFAAPSNIAARLATARAAGTADALRPTVNPDEDVTTFTYYDASGRKLGEVDGEGYLTQFGYDAAGHRTMSWRYAVKPLVPPSVTSKVSELANESAADQATWRSFDSAGRLQWETNNESTDTLYVYDDFGRLVEKTVAFATDERRTSRARYDVQGRVTAELSPEGVAELERLEQEQPRTREEIDAFWAAHATRYTYDAAGRRLTATDALGHRMVWFYDDAGRVRYSVNARGEVSETAYDALGRVDHTTAHATRVAEVTLAGLQGGLLSSAVNAGIEAALAPVDLAPLEDSTTSFEYDAAGRLWRTTDAEGARTEVTFDAFSEARETRQQVDATRTLVTTSTFDRRGLRTGGVADVGGGSDQANATTRIVYDAFGRVEETEDANGNIRNIAYDRLGRVVHVFEPADERTGLGRVTTYDAFDRVETQIDVFGRETRYAYDLAERSVTTTTPEGVVVTIARNRNGQTRSISDGNGNVTRFAYDRRGNLRTTTRTVDGVDVVTENVYDELGRLQFSIDAEQHQVQYDYDAANRLLTRTVDPGGLNLVTGYEYDAKGLQVAVTDPNGTVTRVEFDKTGRVLTRTVDAAPGGLGLVTRYEYDRAGRVLTERNPAGKVTEHHYDRLGRRVETVVDPGGLALRTTYRYDDNGNVVARTDANENVTRYVYGPGDRLVYTVDGAGGVTRQEYDADGRVARTTRYANRIVLTGLPEVATAQQVEALISAAGPTDQPDEVERRFYDDDGRLARVVDGAGGVTAFAYDGNGNVVAQRTYANRLDLSTWDGASLPAQNAQRDRRSYTIYDALGRALFTVDGTGAVVAMTYDRNGNVLDRRALATPLDQAELAAVEVLGDPQGTDAARAAVRQTVVDAVARLADADRDAHIRRRYDAANRLEYSVDGTGGVTRQFFDGAGNLVKQVAYAQRIGAADAPDSVGASAGDRVNVFVFDAAGRATFAVDAMGGVSRQVFDRAGNVVQRIVYGTRISAPAAASAPDTVAQTARALGANQAVPQRSSQSVYDAANRQVAAVDATGAVVAFEYDGIGNIIATTSFATLRPGTRPTVDTQGRLHGLPPTTADDRTELRAYDAAGRLVYSVDPEGYVTRSEFDGAGRRVRSRLYLNPTSGLAAGATSGQIDDALGVVGLANQVDQFGYDAAGHVVRTTDSLEQVETSAYDGAGNLLETRVLDGQDTVTTTYDYDAAGRQVTTTSPPAEVWSVVWSATEGRWVGQRTPGVQLVTRVEYDALGNVTARIDAAGRDEQRTTRFDYDAMGRQERTTLPAVRVYDPQDAGLFDTGMAAVRARSETEPLTHSSEVAYDVFGDARVATDALGNRTYRIYDALGRVRYEVDALGLVTGYERNDYGEVVELTRYAERPALTLDPEAPPTADAIATALAALDHANDRTITTFHDAMGRATTVEQPAAFVDLGGGVTGNYAATTRSFYDAFGQVVRSDALVDPVAGVWASTEHRFDRCGREVTTIDALGYVTAQAYDAAGNLTRRIEYAKALTTPPAGADRLSTLETRADDRRIDFTYDLLNRKETETRYGVECADQDFVVARRNLTTRSYYDRQGNLSRVVDPLGGERRRFYDALGRVRAETGPAVSGVDGVVIPLTRFGYDAFGNVVARTAYARGADIDPVTLAVAETGTPTPALDRTSLTRYDARGNAIEQIDAGGVSHYVSYDAAGRVAKQWQGVTGNDGVARILFGLVRYDAVGRVIAAVSPASTSVVRNGTTIETISQAEARTVTARVSYNAFGEVLARSTAPDAQVATPSDAEFFEYDAAGRVWRTNSGDGVVKVYLYDLLGRRTAQITSDGAVDLLQFASASEVVGQAADQLRVSSYFAGTASKVEQFQFSDGVNWEEASLASTTAHYTGSAGADSITGYDGAGGNEIRGLGGNDTLTGGSQADVLDGGEGADSLYGNAGDDNLLGGEGDDYINGAAGDDTLSGGDGNDTIGSAAGNDVIDGGKGNDALWGAAGNDTYVFRRGDGVDSVSDYDTSAGNRDTIRFADVPSTEVTLQRIGNTLVVNYGPGDAVILGNYFYPSPDSAKARLYEIENFEFFDGVTWGRAEVVARTTTAQGTAGPDGMAGYAAAQNTMYGDDGSDSLFGGNLADSLYGGSGDDVLYGSAGGDVLEGGTGNDSLNGGSGNDTYRVRKGSGGDAIYDGDSTPGNVDAVEFIDVGSNEVTAVERAGNDLVIRYGTSDQVTVSGYFTNYYGARPGEIEEFRFTNGVTWRRTEILGLRPVIRGSSAAEAVGGGSSSPPEYAAEMYGYDGADTLVGGALDDVLDGGSGDDWLVGGAGNDCLEGGTGNDTFDGGAGNDTYLVRRGGVAQVSDYDPAAGNADTIRFVGLDSSEVTAVERILNDLVIKYGAGEQLTVLGYFQGASREIESFQFENVTWTRTNILERCPDAKGTSAADYFTASEAVRFFGLEGSDTLSGGTFDDLLDGGSGDDSLSGAEGNDTLVGGAGNDALVGGAGDDTFDGGAGDDALGAGNYYYGAGAGNDTYVVRRGGGADQIYDWDPTAGNVDRVRFVDITPAEVTSVERIGQDLVLKLGAGDQVTVLQYFVVAREVERFEFAGAAPGEVVVWERAQILERLVTRGTTAGDTIAGVTDAPNRMSGLEAADTLTGGVLDDVIDGGTGDDTLTGGAGSDTYVLRRGSGSDVISDTDGSTDVVRFDDVASTELTAVERQGNDLVVKYGVGDQVRVAGWFSAAGSVVEQFVFSDGVTLAAADLTARAVVIPANPGVTANGTAGDDVLTGGTGDDTLNGSAGADRLDGGAGSDTLSGATGGDTYVLRAGSGQDVILDYDTAGSADAIEFQDLLPAELTAIERRGNDLVIRYGISDQVTISGYFYTSFSEVEQFRFSKGGVVVVWTRADLITRLSATNGTSGNDYLYGYADGVNRISGGEGADTLTGAGVDDVLDGGSGNDNLSGGAGADRLDGGIGNDTMTGDTGGDTYVVRRGSGQDVISDYDTPAGGTDVIDFQDVASTEVTAVERRFNDLVIKYGASDQVTVANYFVQPGWNAATYEVEQLRFADGVTWTRADILARQPITTLGSANDSVAGAPDGQNRIYGGEGADSIGGGNLDDVLDGGSGNDGLYGGAGTDTLDGGAGNDILQGGIGGDVYVLRKGSGQDAIRDEGGVDVIDLQDVASTEVTLVERRLNDLVIKYGATDEVTITDYFREPSYYYPASYEIEQIRFADGSTWGRADLLARIQATKGTSGNDTITGYSDAANRILGGEGWDTLNGGALGDSLDGGSGDDVLIGNTGNDTYIVRRGAGADRIVDSDVTGGNIDTVRFEGVASSEVTAVERRVDDLVIGYGANDQVTIANYFSWSAQYQVEEFTFTGGDPNVAPVTWRRADILEMLQRTVGTNGNDLIYGYAGGVNRMYGGDGADTLYGGSIYDAPLADVFDGGPGDDTLNGGVGNDTYVLRPGSGADVVFDHDTAPGNVDIIRFEGVRSTDVTAVERRGNDLVIRYGSSDQVTIGGYFLVWGFGGRVEEIERFEFSDVIWGRDQIQSLVTTMGAGGDDTITGYSDGSNRIYGFAGADSLTGGPQADLLDGGTGNDTLIGDVGDDTYVVGRGAGADRISDNDPTAGNVDTVRFEAIASSAVTAVERRANDLVLKYGGADQVTVVNYFLGARYAVERFQFADGVSWQGADLLARVRTIGTAGADTLTGDTPDAVLDDVIDGGAGNDVLAGGAGSDTYVLRRGAGLDRITEGVGEAGDRDTVEFSNVASAEAIVLSVGNDLVIRYGARDQVTVVGYFENGASGGQVEEFRFADGVSWDRDAVDARRVWADAALEPTPGLVLAATVTTGETLNGRDGDDSLSGNTGNDQLIGRGGNDVLLGGAGVDVLDGGSGNDALDGGTGNDTYLLRQGSGQDTIWENDSTAGNQDVVRFLDVKSTDVTSVARVGSDLVINYASPGHGGGLRRTDTTYDLLGRVTGQVLPERVGSDGSTVARPVITMEVDRWGNVTRQLDIRNPAWETTSRYDANNNRVEVAQSDGSAIVRADGTVIPGMVLTRTAYDALGRQVMVTDGNGHVNRQVLDGTGNVVRQIHADCRPVYVQARNADDSLRFDAQNRPVYVQVTDPATGQPVFTGGDPIYVQETDAQGRLLFDAAYRPVYVQERNADNTPKFDAQGNPVYRQKLDAANHAMFTPLVPVYEQARDSGGRLRWETAGQVTRSYDAFGDLVRVTDAMVHLTEFGYDALGRNEVIRSETTSVFTVSANDQLSAEQRRQLVTLKKYDEAGRQLAETNGANETTRYDYDLRGNLVKTAEPGDAVTASAVTRSAFDTQGKEIGNLDANRNLATWGYDAFGRLRTHVDLGGATYSYTYDRAGQLVFQRNSRGQSIDYRYDGAGQVIGVHAGVSRAGDQVTTTQDTIYAYNAAGQRVVERTLRHVTQGGTTTDVVDQDQLLAYDALGRLRSVTTQGRLEGVSISFMFDAVGNRMRQTNVFFGAAGTPQTQDLFYAYDEMNRQILVDGAVNNDAADLANIAAGEGHILAYDKAGNRVSDTAWRQEVRKEYYVGSNRVASARLTAQWAGKGAATEYYEYDALNRLSAIKRELPTADYWAITPNTMYTLDVRKYDGASRLVESGPGLTALPPSLVPALLGETWWGSNWATFSSKDDPDALGARTRRTQYDASGRVIRQVSWKRVDPTSGFSLGYSVDQILTYSGSGYSWTTQEPVLVPDPVTGDLVPVQKVGTGAPLFEADGVTPIYEQLVVEGRAQYEQVPVYTNVQAHNPDNTLAFRNGAPILVEQTDYDGSVVPGRFVQQVINGVPQFVQVPVYEQLAVNGVLQFTQGAPRYVQQEIGGVPQYEEVPVYVRVLDRDGRPVFDAAGNPVYEQDVYPDGSPVSDWQGNPVYRQARDPQTQALLFQQGPPKYVQKTDLDMPLFDSAHNPIWVTQGVTHTADLGYDAVGNIAAYAVYDGKTGTTSFFGRTQERFEGYREGVVSGQVSGAASGTTTSHYDVNGFLVGIDDATKDLNDRALANDVNGVVLTKKQGDHVIRQLVVNGNVLGVYGNGVNPLDPTDWGGNPVFIDQREMNRNFQPFTGATPSSAALDYSVRSGDTLQGIARAVYGDATLWYLIADANGLLTDSALRTGQSLTVPARVAGLSNGADTFRPYDPSEIVGSTSPNLPSPKPKKKCDWVQIVVIAVIVVAVSVATYGAASAAMGAMLGATATTAGTLGGSALAASVATGVVAGAAAGAAASATSQLLTGQDFSWRDVGMAALGGAITGGVAEGIGPGGMTWSSAAWTVAGSVTANAAVQLHKMTYGNQKSFNWWAVAAAAASGAVGAAVGAGLDKLWTPGSDLARLGADIVKGTLTGVAAGVTARLVNHLSPAERHHQIVPWDELWMMTADSFGNALGNSTAKAVKKEIQKEEQRQRDRDTLTLRLGGKTAAEMGLDRRPGDQFKLKLGAGGFDYGDESAAELAPGAALAADEAAGASSPSSQSSTHTVGAEGLRGYWGVAQSMLGKGASNADIQRRAQELMSANPGVTTLREGDVLNLGNGTVSADATRTYAAMDESYQAQRAAQRDKVWAALAAVTGADQSGGYTPAPLTFSGGDAAPAPMRYGEEMWHVGQVGIGFFKEIGDGLLQGGMGLVKAIIVGGAGEMAVKAGEDPGAAMADARRVADQLWDGRVFDRPNVEQRLGSLIGMPFSGVPLAAAPKLLRMGGAVADVALGDLAGLTSTAAGSIGAVDEMAGRLAGTLYDPKKLAQLEGYLARRGFTLQVGDKFLPASMAGGFDAEGGRLLLRSNPTEYEVWHELSHWRQYQKVGADAYSGLTRTVKEQFVFDMLENSPKRWTALSFDQQQHAIWYIQKADVGGFR